MGAGIAGLAAARRLAGEGFGVVVLEGRGRIGGRIWTDRSLEVPVDLGAAWIHGISRNPLMDLVRDGGIQTARTRFAALALYDVDGRLLNDQEMDEVEAQVEEIFGALMKCKKEALGDRSVGAVLAELLAAGDLGGVLGRGINWRLASEIGVQLGVDLDGLSLQAFGEDESFNGPDVVFPGGYDQIAAQLAAGLDIRLNYIVRRIDCGADGVEIITDQGSVRASRAVVTLPLGVLQNGDVEFSPALPPAKQDAIRRLQMGTMNKIALRFEERFWPEWPHYMGRLAEGDEAVVEWWNMAVYSDQPVLLALSSGAQARDMERLPEGEVVERLMFDLRHTFGGDIAPPVAAVSTRWHGDPFARGAYSHVPPGAAMADYDALATSVEDRLFFAGEATSRQYPGTVHGALLSGRREAQRIVDLAVS